MPSLTLKITSYQSQTLGADSSKTFNELGGTIGRAQGNDWVLPDPERYISSRHASISFQDGIFYLTDTSTNGVYINGAAEPVGNGNTVALNNGDRLNFGDYEVEISTDAGIAEDQSGPWAAPADEQLVITSPTGRPDMPESLDPLAFTGQPPAGEEEGFPDVFAPPPAEPGAEPDHVSPLAESFQAPGASFEPIPDDWDLTDYSSAPGGGPAPKPAPSIPTPAAKPEAPPAFPPAEPPTPPPAAVPPAAAPVSEPPPVTQPPPVPVQGATGDMFAAFLRGAGLDPASVGQVDSIAAMEGYGALFREVVQGLMEVLMARASLKSEFRMPLTTIRPVENNPLKFSPTVDDALRNLFLSHGSGYLSPEESVREGFADIKCHQMAMVAGMQAAFREMLLRFEPESFDDKEKGGMRAALMSVNKKSRLWDAYCEFYKQVTRDPDSSFQTLFGEEFARAYEEQIRRLSDLRRT